MKLKKASNDLKNVQNLKREKIFNIRIAYY